MYCIALAFHLPGLYFMSSIQRLLREIRVWANLSHPNISRFLGVTSDFDRPQKPCLVSSYYHHGNITNYLKEHPRVNKLLLVSPNVWVKKLLTLLSNCTDHPGCRCFIVSAQYGRCPWQSRSGEFLRCVKIQSLT